MVTVSTIQSLNHPYSQNEDTSNSYSSITSVAQSLGTSVLSKISEYAYPLVVGGVSFCFALHLHLKFRNTGLKLLILKIEKLKKVKGYSSISKTISSFIEKKWPDFYIPSSCNTQQNKQFLITKLEKIIDGSSESTQVKLRICTNAIDYFTKSLNEVSIKINRDTHQGTAFCRLFGLDSNDVVKEIRVIGNETHNRGKNVFSITFLSGKKLIYKPRLMESEQIICGNENSIFKLLRLPTYKIYNKTSENYSYSEFIENNEFENTFNSGPELSKYYEQIAIIEQIAQEIRLTDLHSGNVIASKKQPYLIDTEVVLSPSGIPFVTGLVGGTASGSFVFIEKNRVWLGNNLLSQIPQEVQMNLGNSITKKTLLYLGVDFDAIMGKAVHTWAQEKALNSAFNASIKGYKNCIGQQVVRVVPVDTSLLNNILRMRIRDAQDTFTDAIKDQLKKWKFELLPQAQSIIASGIETDILNDDVPIFYGKPSEGTIYYHGSVIAKIANTPKTKTARDS